MNVELNVECFYFVVYGIDIYLCLPTLAGIHLAEYRALSPARFLCRLLMSSARGCHPGPS